MIYMGMGKNYMVNRGRGEGQRPVLLFRLQSLALELAAVKQDVLSVFGFNKYLAACHLSGSPVKC